MTAYLIQALAGWERPRRSPSPRPGCSCRTSPGCRASSTWPPCERRWRPSAATRPGSTRFRPAELVIDHSVIADLFGAPDSFARNVELEYQRNRERYQFLRWGQSAFNDFKVVPPGTGIVHQVNIEHLARVVFAEDGTAYPDTLVGTDSHTPMVNGLVGRWLVLKGSLGWLISSGTAPDGAWIAAGLSAGGSRGAKARLDDGVAGAPAVADRSVTVLVVPGPSCLSWRALSSSLLQR